MPVNIIEIFLSSAAAITSRSLMDPPGWIIAVTPALTAEIKPSGKGKNASLATTLPIVNGWSKLAISAAAIALFVAIFVESILLICPAPIPVVWRFFA